MRGLLSPLPLRVRITVWVVAIFAVVHVSLSLVTLLLYRQSLDRQIRADLIEAGRSVEGESAAESRLGLALQVIQGAPAARWGPLACIVVDAAGTVVNAAGPYDSNAMDTLAAEASTDRHRDGSVRTSDDERFMYSVSHVAGSQRLVVAAPTGHAARAMEPAVIIFVMTLSVGLIASGVATWIMSGIAIRPLLQVKQFAEELSAENVLRAIDIDDAAPEVEVLRQELEQAMSRIGKGYEQQARFLANVSHELKTPISVMRTEADVLLARTAAEPELREFARSTSEEMARLGRVVESLLLLTRMRHGTEKVRAERTDANELLIEAIGQCKGMADQYRVLLVPTLDAHDSAPTIEGNADLLQTAIGNLIRNAIRFSPQGERIEVTCMCAEQQVEFAVRDFGPGVSDDLLHRIFEPFTQSDDERHRGRGTGLGLQIAQGIAELHGGQISVENTEPGCRFRLTLALARATH